MHLHATISTHHPSLQLPSLASSSSSISRTLLGFRRPILLRQDQKLRLNPIRCSISKVHNYGTVDYERRPGFKWSVLYRRISMMENPSLGSAVELDRWEEEERKLSKWELSRVVKELRKFRRFKLALEVYDWMTAKQERFVLSSSDMAIQLDLIAKVHGISSAEEHFSRLPETLKDKRTYGALLNAYGQAKMKEKAEAIVEIMREKGFATDALPFNVMMTLYMNVGEHEKVNMIISELKERNVAFDIYSYNIWITNCAAMEDTEEMEQVVERMTSDSSINANWTTYTTLATMYIKLGNFEKAQRCLKDVESRVTGRDRTAFNYLIGLYGSIGKKEEVYRIWKWYKSSFPSMLNMAYHSMISSLIRLRDIEGAEMIYEEWVSTTPNYDPRICNMMMGWYVREGLVDKAKGLLDRLLEMGGKPKPITWEILAEGHTREKELSKALSCMREAASYKGERNWMPRPRNIANFLALCKEQRNMESMEVLVDLLKKVGCVENEEYKSLIAAYAGEVV